MLESSLARKHKAEVLPLPGFSSTEAWAGKQADQLWLQKLKRNITLEILFTTQGS